MIVVDTSALIAIFFREHDASLYSDRLLDDPDPRISAATLLETSIVMRLQGEQAAAIADRVLDTYVAEANIQVCDVTPAHVEIARDAHRLYGKGLGHPAQLNFGDCFAYALAKSLKAPLLYKGGDFAKTDIASAL